MTPGERSFIAWHLGMAAFFVALGLFLSGCAFMPNEAVPFTPPESYRAVWDSAQACTGVQGSMDRIAFYKMPGRNFAAPGQEKAAGYGDHQRIIIAEDYLDHPMVVKHEMIHILIGRGHPREPFEVPCKATWDSWVPEPSLSMNVGPGGSAGGVK